MNFYKLNEKLFDNDPSCLVPSFCMSLSLYFDIFSSFPILLQSTVVIDEDQNTSVYSLEDGKYYFLSHYSFFR